MFNQLYSSKDQKSQVSEQVQLTQCWEHLEERGGALIPQLWAWGRFPGDGMLLPEDCIS